MTKRVLFFTKSSGYQHSVIKQSGGEPSHAEQVLRALSARRGWDLSHTKDGSVFNAAERMSRVEALRSYTINGAYAAFEEDTRGTIKPGKYADLVVLSKDILTIPEDDIPSTEVSYTIVGGKIRYQRPR